MQERMRNNLLAVKANLRTEFPDWRLLLAFGGYSLNPAPNHDFVVSSLRRVAWHLCLKGPSLVLEYDRLLALARRRLPFVGGDSRLAFVEAIKGMDARIRNISKDTAPVVRVEGSREFRSIVPSSRRVACKWGVSSSSTVGLECGFGLMGHVVGKRRLKLSDARLSDEMTIVMDGGGAVSAEIVKQEYVDDTRGLRPVLGPWAVEAQALWKIYFPKAQSRQLLRSDVGGKHRRPTLLGRTERIWREARIATLKRIPSAERAALAAKAVVKGPVTELVQKELNLQAKRQRNNITDLVVRGRIPHADRDAAVAGSVSDVPAPLRPQGQKRNQTDPPKTVLRHFSVVFGIGWVLFSFRLVGQMPVLIVFCF